MHYLHPSDYDSVFEELYVNRFDNSDIHILFSKKQGNRENIIAETENEKIRIERTEIEGFIIEKIFVLELFKAEDQTTYKVSDDIPILIKAYVNVKDNKELNYIIDINNPSKDFSYEELSEFSMEQRSILCMFDESNVLDINKIDLLINDMTYNDLVNIIGFPNEEVGDGTIIFKWKLSNGKSMTCHAISYAYPRYNYWDWDHIYMNVIKIIN